jgi:hypothetical protein
VLLFLSKSTTTPIEVKFQLEARLLDLANDGGPLPVIAGVHSVAEENGTVGIIYDVMRGTEEGTLWFDFLLPVQNLSRTQLPEFARWLASPSYGTAH